MRQKTLMIFLSCAIGSGAGFLFAKNFGIFWILGILLGGFAGYILYDYKQVIASVPTAFKYAKEKIGGWNNVWVYIVTTVEVLLALAVIFGYPVSLFIISFTDEKGLLVLQPGVLSGLMLMIAFGLCVCMCLINALVIINKASDLAPSERGKVLERLLGILKVIAKTNENNFVFLLVLILSPFLTLFSGFKLMFYDMPKIISKWAIKQALFISAFLWKLFKLIHSEERFIVGIDSIIGGFVGFYYFDNILLCMIIGGLLGVINYEIVSIRILKQKLKT